MLKLRINKSKTILKVKGLVIITGIIITAALFIYAQEKTSIKRKDITANIEFQNNIRINKFVAEVVKNPELMKNIMNRLDEIDNPGAKRVIAICDSLTGLKDDHYMILKMFYGDDQ